MLGATESFRFGQQPFRVDFVEKPFGELLPGSLG
jgi:hypothetical protein